MSDWLAELRESRVHAIEHVQGEIARGQVVRAATAEQLHARQEQLARLIWEVEPERLLEQMVREILSGHPYFSETTLIRTLRSQGVEGVVDLTEPEPWSGPVEGNPLPTGLELGNGHYAIGVEWKLQSNFRRLHDHEIQPYCLRVSVSPGQLTVDGQPVSSATADALKAQLATTFKSRLEQLSRRRSRHHRHRPWHRRVWRALFPRIKPTPAIVIATMVILLLAVVAAIVAGQLIAGRLVG